MKLYSVKQKKFLNLLLILVSTTKMLLFKYSGFLVNLRWMIGIVIVNAQWVNEQLKLIFFGDSQLVKYL